MAEDWGEAPHESTQEGGAVVAANAAAVAPARVSASMATPPVSSKRPVGVRGARRAIGTPVQRFTT